MALETAYTIAAVSGDSPGDVDEALSEVARALGDRGLRVAGAVQHNTERPGRRCDMTLTVLPRGAQFQISEDRGRMSSGCRLDAGGLSNAVHALEQDLRAGCDALVLNKLGAREVEGEGFAPALAEAAIARVPILIGVGHSKRAALEMFVGAPVELLPLDVQSLTDWVIAAAAPSPR